MSGIRLTGVSAATIPTPPSGKVVVFIDSSNGEPSYKDDTGAVHTLEGPTGPAGTGTTIRVDGIEDVEEIIAGTNLTVVDNEDGTVTLNAAGGGGGGGGGGIEAIDDIAQLAGWWDADDSGSLTLDGSSRVEQWSDKSGGGVHASQGTAGSRPHTVSHGGRTWIDCSQGNHFLSTTGPALWRAARTYFAVVYLPYSAHTGKGRRTIFEAYAQYYQGGMEITAANENALALNAHDGSLKSATDSEAFPLETAVVVSSSLVAGGGMRIHRNNVGRGRAALGTNTLTDFTGFRFGTYRDTNDRWFDGYIGEIVMVSGEMSSQERQAVVDLLLAKWS